ncbi:Asp23/Gls24 family envelope stress response protein [Corynebacterium silvaticum]|uniref:Asp23/Gls24 family envelope stress response protein n=1 Tax=Corynebacterium silvaticum TaxID=2320431 RepID=A0A7Y4P9B8_9CORY|nr:Asp23/Gls24 family envelope stress response protein [Corynebacterium silvaticum]ARU45508.1 Asp23/Gls24 family envelope stress response protein [Corynebacterium silvaticum]MBH5300088.1 Asp23/Gls24 family envelope stress response protein [Corynebacterium silvaticum]NOM65387.1 Asp23/Gls24 family envelope stress response protein [Corynebacterium silvaticum]NON70544.1 Asp23/Gls24 family envelope stress response protein [Corynebacterium silvaticum]TFA92408.1 Asp23/Gls24 family envelope stress res
MSDTQNAPAVETSTAGSPTTLETTHGRTVIEDTVVAKIAGLATREVSGVHAVGGNAARVVGALRDSIPGSRTNLQQGVEVEVGERQAAVDVAIVAEYGVAIHQLAQAIRQNIINAIERMTGLEVTEVNVTVHDVHLELDEDEGEANDSPAHTRVH